MNWCHKEVKEEDGSPATAMGGKIADDDDDDDDDDELLNCALPALSL